MTLATSEFIRRFLIHVLPGGFHRIRHYGLFASGSRVDNIARARELLAAPPRPCQPNQDAATDGGEPKTLSHPCPCCGGRMIVIETFRRGTTPRYRPTAPIPAIRIDTS
jgi:Putative transposase